jgi:uncharacterized protein
VNWLSIVGITAVMAVSALVQGAVGFGLGLLALPFLIYVDLRFVPGPLLLAALALHMMVLRRDRSGIDVSGLSFLLSGRLLGTIPAMWLLAVLPVDQIKIVLALITVAGALMAAVHTGGQPTRAVLFSAGTASGFMATLGALGGPPVALVYQHSSGQRLRGTLAAFFIVGTVVSLAALGTIGRFGVEELRLSLLLIPGTILGFMMSHRAAAYLDTGYTRTAVLAVSILTAISVIATVLM